MFFKDLDENLKKFIYGEKVNIDKTVIQSFQEQVKKTPKKIAIVDSDLKFTYEELDIISSIFSNYLLDLGLKKGSKVAILVGRTIYMPISFISLLKIGIIYVPIDSLSPNERVKHMIKDSESIIVTDDSVYKIESIQITQINTSIINEIVDKVRDGRASISDESIRKNSPSLDDEFIVLYTSGTTGNPKGAILTHRNIANLARYYADHYSINNCSNIGAFASFGFDFSLADFYPALISGATVYIVPNEFRTNIMNLNNFYNVNNITHSGITTQLGRQFIISCDNNSLKHLLLGGEKLMPITPPKNYTVHNIYGPTECTVSVTDFVLDELHETRVPIGTPVYNTGIYIMNNKNELVKPGELGEICIEGDQVFKGYINKSETKKSLCKNPYTQKKMYRTGDIGTYLADGNIDILGRKDTQVKVRGFRIELSEVEKAIIEYENVLDVTTIALSASNGEKMIVAYVVPKDKNSFIVSELNEFLQDCLIKYMIPQFIMVLNSLPVNQNGKVDKKNLPKPNLNTYLTSIPPKNKTEKDFIELFKNVLHEDDANIGAEDSFFDIGGSSLTATILLVEASKIGYEISYKDIFENPTPAKLALFVSKKDEYFDEEHSYNNFKTVTNYDYSKIDELLSKNTVKSFVNGTKQKIGNILLTGSTGFLGIHLLHEFIKNHDGIAYCLIRPDQKVGSTNRLQSLLEYHFHDNYKDLFTDRIVVIDGDLTKKDFFSKCSDLSIDTIINAAANVKHFSQSDDIEKVNICGVENLLEFSRNKNINFIQISTTSIGGDAYKTSRFNNTLLDENTFFFGQDLSNKYCYSKFMAERLCFEEALKGENIKIMRVGNLMGRESDGGFQINFDTNAFLNLVRSFCLIGQVPYNIMVNKIFMDSIDATAKSILLLATTPKENILLHPFNNHQVMVLDIFKVISEFGINVKSVESNDFNVGLKKVLSNHKNILYLNSLLQLDSADNMGFDNINNDLTISILLRLNYQFSIIDDDYLRKCIDHLCKIGFFDL